MTTVCTPERRKLRLQEALAVAAALTNANRANTTPASEAPTAISTLYDVISQQLKSLEEYTEYDLENVEFHTQMRDRYEERVAAARCRIQELEQRLRALEADGHGPRQEAQTLDLQELQARLAELIHE